MTATLTASININLGADNRAVTRVRGSIIEGYDIAALHIGPLTLQWDDPAHAEAFLLAALESLRAERERYAQAGAA